MGCCGHSDPYVSESSDTEPEALKLLTFRQLEEHLLLRGLGQ